MTASREPAVLLALAAVALVLSGIGPKDRFTWFLEVAPVLMGAPLLIWFSRRVPLTLLMYRLLFVHALILMVGAHWTYAEVPLGFWMRDAFGFARNHYDRIGHFAQGFVPALLAREVLLRKTPLRRGGWLLFLVTCVCLAFSALYELIEWWASVATGTAADAFLGTQGDPWDTQSDTCLALIGAVCALVLLARRHDREMAALDAPAAVPQLA
jgi:putative membrane protein